MAEDDLSCSVRFGFWVNCDSDEPHDYVVAVEGVVLAHLDPPEDEPDIAFVETEAGRVQVLVVQTTQAMSDGLSLCAVCETHSPVLASVFTALFDPDSEEPKEELGIAPAWEGLLYLDRIIVGPEYRDRGVVVTALEPTIRSVCPRGIVAARLERMDLLTAEWRELGFVRIAGSEVIFRDNTSYNLDGPAFEEELGCRRWGRRASIPATAS